VPIDDSEAAAAFKLDWVAHGAVRHCAPGPFSESPLSAPITPHPSPWPHAPCPLGDFRVQAVTGHGDAVTVHRHVWVESGVP
jgi:hypothetical protein